MCANAPARHALLCFPARWCRHHVLRRVRSQGQAERAYKVVWSAQEQRDLEAAMTRYPESRYPPLERYLRIAASLPQKASQGMPLRRTASGLLPQCRSQSLWL